MARIRAVNQVVRWETEALEMGAGHGSVLGLVGTNGFGRAGYCKS